MYLFPNQYEGLALLQDKFLNYADLHSKEINLTLVVDKGLIAEAFQAACGSAQFHQIKLEHLSHYKELAHIGFWISQLKPIWIEPPYSPEFFIEQAKLAAQQAVFGHSAVNPPAAKAYSRANEAYRKHATFPISEFLALRFIADGIETEFLRKCRDLKDDEHRAVVMRRFNHFKIVLQSKVIKDVAMALRFHVFTPRSFATLVESIFAFEGFE